jgi:hypothetical protein
MKLWEILVPCVRNSGKPFRTRHHKEWDRQVRKISKGITVMTPAKGQWLNADGDLYEERMIPVRIACGEDEIKKIMDIAAKHYKQRAIMAYLVSDFVLIKEYNEYGE